MPFGRRRAEVLAWFERLLPESASAASTVNVADGGEGEG